MTRCNGCGNDGIEVVGVMSYGDITTTNKNVNADYQRTLCERCTRVLKDVLLNSDLSEHWEDGAEL